MYYFSQDFFSLTSFPLTIFSLACIFSSIVFFIKLHLIYRDASISKLLFRRPLDVGRNMWALMWVSLIMYIVLRMFFSGVHYYLEYIHAKGYIEGPDVFCLRRSVEGLGNTRMGQPRSIRCSLKNSSHFSTEFSRQLSIDEIQMILKAKNIDVCMSAIVEPVTKDIFYGVFVELGAPSVRVTFESLSECDELWALECLGGNSFDCDFVVN